MGEGEVGRGTVASGGPVERPLVKLRLKTVVWPQMCACCGGPAETTIESKRGFLRSRSRYKAPACIPCRTHAERWRSGDSVAGAIGAITLAIGVGVQSMTGSPSSRMLFLVGFPVAVLVGHRLRAAARKLCGATCTAVQPAVVDLPAPTIGFTSGAYAIEVARANGVKGSELPEHLRRQLEPPPAIVAGGGSPQGE